MCIDPFKHFPHWFSFEPKLGRKNSDAANNSTKWKADRGLILILLVWRVKIVKIAKLILVSESI